MDESQDSGLELSLELETAPGTETLLEELPARGWRGRVSELEPAALQGFWLGALAYARWEIGQYRRWREQEEPVLADGYDAEGIVQQAFARLMKREARGVPIYYTAEELRDELRALVKHRVRWLHERKETSLVVSEWDVLPPREDDELVSVFDYMPGNIAPPDEAIMEAEEEKLREEFRAGFEETLVKRKDLADVFRRLWAGEKRREMARRLGLGVQRIKGLQREVKRRLVKFAEQARGGVAEMLGSLRKW